MEKEAQLLFDFSTPQQKQLNDAIGKDYLRLHLLPLVKKIKPNKIKSPSLRLSGYNNNYSLQSFTIMFGNATEQFLNQIITDLSKKSNGDIENLLLRDISKIPSNKNFGWKVEKSGKLSLIDKQNKTRKGNDSKIQLDFLAIVGSTIIYRELKNNLDLDSEKSPAACKKIKKIETALYQLFPSYKIDCGYLNQLEPIINPTEMCKFKGTKVDGFDSFSKLIPFPFSFKDLEEFCKKEVGPIIQNSTNTFRDSGDVVLHVLEEHLEELVDCLDIKWKELNELLAKKGLKICQLDK